MRLGWDKRGDRRKKWQDWRKKSQVEKGQEMERRTSEAGGEKRSKA